MFCEECMVQKKACERFDEDYLVDPEVNLVSVQQMSFDFFWFGRSRPTTRDVDLYAPLGLCFSEGPSGDAVTALSMARQPATASRKWC